MIKKMEKLEVLKDKDINDVIYMGKFIVLDMIIDKMKSCNKKDFIDYCKLFIEIYQTKDGEKHE